MKTIELFELLKRNPSKHAFTIVEYPGRRDVYIGRDAQGRPSLFARTSELLTEPPLRTGEVSLRIGQVYEVAPLGESVRRERFHSLSCETSDESEVATFLLMMEALLASHSKEQLTEQTIVSFFRSMKKLFSISPDRDLQAERQGLWGELFMMSRVHGFSFWASSWHNETTRAFDFTSGSKHVEVKSAIGGQRIHHFAHRQLYELEGEQTVIASLLLRVDPSGLSLRELIDAARKSFLGSEHYFKLEQAVRLAGMRSDDSGPAYDPSQAENSLAWFRAVDAPHFRMAEPPGVSQTHYRADLSLAPQVSIPELDTWLQSWAVLTLEESREAIPTIH
jgi:hypothetical protein